MIRLRNVKKTYRQGDRRVTACHVDALDVQGGEQIAVIGRSGMGKTTLLNIIAGILRPDSGEVVIGGTHLDGLGEGARDRFRALHIGMVFQTFNLLQPFTAVENVMLGTMFGRGAHGQMRQRAEELLDRVGLGDRGHHRPSELSVGQVQRVAICRALINNPDLILMDEPLGNQDKETGGRVLDMLLKMAEESGKTVVMVTHDPGSAARMQRTVDLDDLREAS